MIDDPHHPPTPADIPAVFHKTEKLLVALLESASQAIVVADRAGCMVLANRRASQMFGYTSQELLGAAIELLLPESKRGAHGPRWKLHVRASAAALRGQLALSRIVPERLQIRVGFGQWLGVAAWAGHVLGPVPRHGV